MRSIIAFTVLAMALVVGAMFLYYRDGGSLVAAQDNTVGEMLLDEGLRFEAGRDWKQAEATFRLAESARFEGEKNLRHLQLKLGHLTDDVSYYRLATTGYELAKIKPSLWHEAWKWWCHSLELEVQWDALEKVVEEWTKAVEAAGPRGIYQTSVDQNLDRSERARIQALLLGHQGKFEEAEELLRVSWSDEATVLWGRPQRIEPIISMMHTQEALNSKQP
jgi:hypothetical protein